jgi:CHAT domain-containing protein
VVVLFVCSGGRSNKVPGAIATSGVARRLLHQGCSAVIASPWPLDARVTYHRLPAFLSAWRDDCRLDAAVLAANRAVEQAIGPAFENTLAMTLFGDPALRQ